MRREFISLVHSGLLSVTGHINKGVKKSQRTSRMTAGYRSSKKVPTMWHIYKTWLDGMERVVTFSPFVPVQKLLNQVTAWPVLQLSLLFGCKRREGFFVVIALFCFDFKKCFSKFRKRKLKLCQGITEFVDIPSCSPPELGISLLFSRFAPTPIGGGAFPSICSLVGNPCLNRSFWCVWTQYKNSGTILSFKGPFFSNPEDNSS